MKRAVLLENISSICEKHAYNGVVFLSRYKKKLVYKPFGYSDLSSKAPIKKDMLFRIGSITKQFTAVAILQLVEHKLLKLSDPIAMYIDEVDYEEEVTVHHLLSNSSGIPNFNPMNDFEGILSTNRVNELLVKEVILKQPLNFVPGSRFEYSSSGYVILAYLIELIAKQPYDQYLKEHIFKPLKMKHSGFHFKETPSKGFANLYDMEDGKVIKAKDIDMRLASGGGGLYSSIKDLYLWNFGLLSYRILSRKYVEKMFTVHTPITERGGYGYGVISIKETIHDKSYPIIYHSGNGPGVFAQSMIYDNKYILVMLSNINDSKRFRDTLDEIDGIVKLLD